MYYTYYFYLLTYVCMYEHILKQWMEKHSASMICIYHEKFPAGDSCSTVVYVLH